MSVTVERPVAFQEPGQVCESCRAFWKAQNLPPQRMISLGKSTEERGIEIVVCPHCDGDTILRLNR